MNVGIDTIRNGNVSRSTARYFEFDKTQRDSSLMFSIFKVARDQRVPGSIVACCSLRSWRYGAREIKVLAAEPPEASDEAARLRRSVVGSASKTSFRVRLQ